MENSDPAIPARSSAPSFAAVVTAIAGVLGFILISRILNRKKSKPIQTGPTLEQPVNAPAPTKTVSKRNVLNPKPRSAAAVTDKAQKRHPLELITLKGHADAITAVAFSANGSALGTACADRVVRIFKLDDVPSKGFQFFRINMPTGSCPTGIAFGENASTVILATQDITGAGLLIYGPAAAKSTSAVKEQGKSSLELKWENRQIHGQRSIISLAGACAESASGDKSFLVASCSEGTDIKLWLVADGKCIDTIDTNQLKNTMVALSPDGRFIAAAAFTADVKIWECVYGKDGKVRQVDKVMQLKGHKSAVTWLCFTSDSKRIVTASKDGSIRIWNINVRYHLDEDPKCLKSFPIPPCDEKGEIRHYDMIALSPDNKVLAATHGSVLQWLNIETGEVLDTASNAHDAKISSLCWSPQPILTDRGRMIILASGGGDKKVKLWLSPP